MLSKRSSGILLHPSSLPSRGGIGDFGPAAYEFVDWLAAAKQTLWQVLPLGPVGCGNSPYSCTSAFAGNVLMISLERLADRGLLERERVESLPDGDSPVDFESVRAHKLPLLREAADKLLRTADAKRRERYDDFCRENEWWLEDYVLFSVLREHYDEQRLESWPQELASATLRPLTKIRVETGAGTRRGTLSAICLLRAMERAARVLRRARHPHHRRCCHLRQLRQRRRLDPSRNFSAERRSLARRWSPAFRPTLSARPGSAGEIRFTTGTR